VAKVAAVINAADRSFTLLICVLHGSGKPDRLLTVRCGRPVALQSKHRLTCLQLGVNPAGRVSRLLNRYLLAPSPDQA
jgi:hypothetical protein